MTALVPVFGPDDFAATVAAARLHEPVRVVVPAAQRGWWYRGQHRQNGFRLRVRDLVPSFRAVETLTGRALVPYVPINRYMRHTGFRVLWGGAR